ncbi:hypothetical protein TNCV_3713981 [Trichonephila clavipes]|nr:hypothetical protein TNCV_3713981 [Trichonephila clavipes]
MDDKKSLGSAATINGSNRFHIPQHRIKEALDVSWNKRKPPESHKLNMRRVPSLVSSGPTNRQSGENLVPACLKQPKEGQVIPDYLVPVHREEQWL